MSPVLRISAAVAEDAAAVRALTREAYAKWVPVIGREPKPMGVDYALAVLSHRVDLLHRDGALVGLIEMVPKADHLLIENIAVSPPHQGMGLGRRLLNHADETARVLSLDQLRLYTNSRFVENIRLYSGHGYRIDSEDDIDGGMVRVHMSKRLT